MPLRPTASSFQSTNAYRTTQNVQNDPLARGLAAGRPVVPQYGMLGQRLQIPTGFASQMGQQGMVNPNALLAMQQNMAAIQQARQRQMLQQQMGMQGIGAAGPQQGAIYGGAPINQIVGLVPGGTPMPGGMPRPGGQPGMFPGLQQQPIGGMQQPPQGLTGFALANWQAKQRRKNRGNALVPPNAMGGQPSQGNPYAALSSGILGGMV